ncbi:DUF86 domain-containing protein [Rhizobiales bacterium RZME27]|jgi:uncharacterized protein with HEPN domain|uniref:DUF86 domain-containing protein n=1 Tax=Endobacterium cereale TaxID=2663029 RepID=A0A6A8AEU4_9HYPH|nr:HepT-like ribonuclease domain-containing protein [Endobacterium cereale]MEB2842890.1 HepT-like ribonuclease domain-containing protein [Endobacterium cereale]MQY49853.1 DUF86 domain-containing protein [Endobacterium cereale]
MTDSRALYLHQMRTAAADVVRFIEAMSNEDFRQNVMVQRAVGMSILMLGEAALRLSREYPEFPVDHPEFPWPAIQDLRNRIANGYFDIELDIVWRAASVSLPELIDQLHALGNWRAQGE